MDPSQNRQKKTLIKLWITDLGSSDVIFGFPWFKENNPQIVWKLGESNCQKLTLKRLSSILLKMDKGGERSKKKKTNFERNYCNKVHRKETEQNMNRPCLKERRDDNQTTKSDPEPLLSRRNEDQGKFQRRIPLRQKERLDLTKSKPEQIVFESPVRRTAKRPQLGRT